MIDTPGTPTYWNLIGGTNEIVRIKRMGKLAGEIYTRTKHSDVMSPEDISDLSNRLWPNNEGPALNPDATPRYDPYRRKFAAVMWLIGASQAQIARHYGVTQQTIHHQLDRELRDMVDRNAQRLRQPPMDHELFEYLETTYYGMLKTDKSLVDLNAIQLAIAFLSLADGHSQEMKQRDDAYAELTTPAAFKQTEEPEVVKPQAVTMDQALEAMKRKHGAS